VVDIYDALKSVRPYKCAMSSTDAIRTMRDEVGRGWWDPCVLDCFEHLLEDDRPDFQSPHEAVEYVQ